ncbi:NAD(FAD)-utilizing dehydrogenase [Halobacillus litoralis]|uniref:NAD(FAD)-utilizing dehydrogenase n=1 Tax=Halobacillus litoralis TaxID=45668 RepID=UPI001CFED8A6|nr:NAD(FAD)-utilizing dehydrogenase [Halobacillus litoralis]
MHDVTIIGAGVSSIFLALSLIEKSPDCRIHVIDKGKPLAERSCGLDEGRACTCEDGCEKYIGFAGLGKSEGKFNYTNDFGGELAQKIGETESLRYMRKVDQILCSFGGDAVEKYSTKNEHLSQRSARYALNVFSTDVRHLGTGLAQSIFQKMYDQLIQQVSFTFCTSVQKLERIRKGFRIQTNSGDFFSSKVVLATGNSGSEWLHSMADKLGLKPQKTRLDLGIRVEMRGNQLDSILQDTFETKLNIKTDTFSATTYCMNPNGRIIRKYQHGLVMPDGQNKREKKTPGSNLNFSLFVPRYYDNHKEAMSAAERVIGGINRGSNRIVVQRYEDLRAGKRSKGSCEGSICPSLQAEAGDLREEVPDLYIESLLEFFTRLEGLLGESIDSDTLLYGLDAKFYEAHIFTDPYFQTSLSGLYLVGDCSGVTHSLAQAAASGLYLGQHMVSSQAVNYQSADMI